ncbi:RAD51-associated protein 1 [Danio rerio]|uniref:RAD51-associated protein 1 n=1 Tax=Danio rerio TaxID=7955 RepID=A3KNR8_DANRE|nr:RAD51-associated protein 1 [Danio rerio]AAI33973.1 Si:ch211-240j22.5 protein [Danio rerio]|eukprot:NP_001037803.2 RAD51-associated protein 1 [Danio rerio]
MDRPSRSKKTVNYSDFQDDDDEDFACVKPPPKKARTDSDSEKSSKTTSTPANGDVDLASSESRKRVSLDAKRYERDLEEALTLSLREASKAQDGEPTTKSDGGSADDDGGSRPPQCAPPVLIHCSADDIHPAGEDQPRPESPPVLSNCSIDGRSLGLNIISLDSSPPMPSKWTESSEKRRKSQEEKRNKDDDDYQPQNTPDSESDADFTEEEENDEDETFTVKKKKDKVVKQKTGKKATPAVKEKKEKKPTKAVKAKSTAPSPSVCRSPAAPVSISKKAPSTPPISKPALCSSPAGGRLPKWNPPGMVGRSPGASQNGSLKSPGQGLRLGLSRLARVKPLHPNVAAN